VCDTDHTHLVMARWTENPAYRSREPWKESAGLAWLIRGLTAVFLVLAVVRGAWAGAAVIVAIALLAEVLRLRRDRSDRS